MTVPSLPFEERLRLLLQQMHLECIAVGEHGVMTPFPCANPDTPPRVIVSTLGDRARLFVRHDVPAPIRDTLIALDPDSVDEATVTAALAEDAPCPAIWHNRAAIVPPGVLAGHYPEAEHLAGSAIGATAFGIIVDGDVVAACSSVREDDRSAEAWVFTDERHRRRGYASQVVAAWAGDLHRQGKTPFYSYLLENTASHALAATIGVVPFAESTGFV